NTYPTVKNFTFFIHKQSINFRLSFEFFLNARIALFYWLSSIFPVGRYFSFLCTFPSGLAVKSGKEVVNSFITSTQQFDPVDFLFPSVSLLPLQNLMLRLRNSSMSWLYLHVS